jgi:signal recognition particle receptor subunit beta
VSNWQLELTNKYLHEKIVTLILTLQRYLYDILTKASVVNKKIPVLLLCNKTDKVTAHTKEFIRKQMEKEMYGF